jgi:hypothetical protein
MSMRVFCATVLLVVGLLFPVFSQTPGMIYEQDLADSPLASTYKVEVSGIGKNLSPMADELYGDQYQWLRIYRADKVLIDN